MTVGMAKLSKDLKSKIDAITDDQLAAKIASMAHDLGVAGLLAIPGVQDLVSASLNDDAITALITTPTPAGK